VEGSDDGILSLLLLDLFKSSLQLFYQICLSLILQLKQSPLSFPLFPRIQLDLVLGPGDSQSLLVTILKKSFICFEFSVVVGDFELWIEIVIPFFKVMCWEVISVVEYVHYLLSYLIESLHKFSHLARCNTTQDLFAQIVVLSHRIKRQEVLWVNLDTLEDAYVI